MKKTLLMLTLLGSSYAYSQDSLYTKEQLKSTGKLSLTTIYLNEVNQVVNLMPSAIFSDYNMKNDVPNNKYVNSRREKVAKEMEQFNEVYMEKYRDIVPYADKEELIKGILYLQDVIAKLKGGVK
jgi:hypothetical protein